MSIPHISDEAVTVACHTFLDNLADHQKHYEIDRFAMEEAIKKTIPILIEEYAWMCGGDVSITPMDGWMTLYRLRTQEPTK